MLKTATVVHRIDDIDGTTGDGVKTRRVTLDIELELTDANYAKVKADLTELARKGRKPDGKRARRRVAKAAVAAAVDAG